MVELNLSGKTVLVTGGTKGIGAVLVRTLLDCGAHVAAHYASSKPAKGEKSNDRLHFIQSDLSKPEAATALWNDAVAWRGRVDVLVNNAGLVAPTTIDEAIPEWLQMWQRTLDINLLSPALLCRHAVHHFREKRGGIVINIASRAAFRGDDPHLMHYAASKGGLVALTRSIARGYAKDGILAYIVAPGFVRTERQEGVIALRGEQMLRDIPLGEMARPEDIAPTVAFLASGLARHATGTTIDINGASYVR
ncbi:SDR family NAD(P)-dependent oxidoreductase [Sinorhizobium meliloti]|uniref:SDR family NAD(P)-dependent oxidoreductase n=1 Tax=Rhizobium meliloti TaxID=382 RepID=UPI003D645EBC